MPPKLMFAWAFLYSAHGLADDAVVDLHDFFEEFVLGVGADGLIDRFAGLLDLRMAAELHGHVDAEEVVDQRPFGKIGGLGEGRAGQGKNQGKACQVSSRQHRRVPPIMDVRPDLLVVIETPAVTSRTIHTARTPQVSRTLGTTGRDGPDWADLDNGRSRLPGGTLTRRQNPALSRHAAQVPPGRRDLLILHADQIEVQASRAA